MKILNLFQLYYIENIKERTFCLNLGKCVNHEIVSFIPLALHSLAQTLLMMTMIIHELLQRSVPRLHGSDLSPSWNEISLPVLTLKFIFFILLKCYISFRLPTKRKYIWFWNVHLRFQIQYIHLYWQCMNKLLSHIQIYIYASSCRVCNSAPFWKKIKKELSTQNFSPSWFYNFW